MKLQEYLSKEQDANMHKLLKIIYLAGVPAILALSLLDFVAAREHFTTFLSYRLSVSLVFVISYLSLLKKRSITTMLLISYTTLVVVCSMVEMMVIDLGGPDSGYYVGFILIVIFLGFFPHRGLSFTLVMAVIVHAVYIIPLLIKRYPIDITFMNNVFFLFSANALNVIQRYFNETKYTEKLILQYQVEKEKRKIEAYSHDLEAEVETQIEAFMTCNKQFKSLFAAAPDGIVIFDEFGEVKEMNNRFLEIFNVNRNRESLQNVCSGGFLGNGIAVQERFASMLGGTANFEIEIDIGGIRCIDVTSSPVEVGKCTHVQAFYRDVTEKKKMQEQLHLAQKMDSLGMLAGTVAHDFNNIISSIMAHLDNIGEVTDPSGRESVKSIDGLTKKATKLIKKLFGFARGDSRCEDVFYLDDLISDLTDLLATPFQKNNVSIETYIQPELPPLKGISSDIEQMIMNLLVNARDAMPGGGTVTIKAKHEHIQRFDDVYGMPSAEYIRIEIADQGIGISHTIRSKVFEPFFSTKDKGSGIGLSVVYSLVKKYNGFIKVNSDPGQGTVFAVYFPCKKTCLKPSDSIRTQANTGIVLHD